MGKSKGGFIYTYFISFGVYLHVNLVTSLLARFANRMASQKKTKLIECYKLSCTLKETGAKAHLKKQLSMV